MFCCPTDGARSLDTETEPKVQEREGGRSLFQFFSLFHRGNFYPFPLTIFILSLKHTRLQADVFVFFSLIGSFCWVPLAATEPLSRQTDVLSETPSKCKDESAGGPHTHEASTKRSKKRISEAEGKA